MIILKVKGQKPAGDDLVDVDGIVQVDSICCGGDLGRKEEIQTMASIAFNFCEKNFWWFSGFEIIAE